MSWLGTRLSIEILKSALLCVRGSRTPFRRTSENIDDDFLLNNIECDIHRGR